jgi:HlyD family secretion protein
LTRMKRLSVASIMATLFLLALLHCPVSATAAQKPSGDATAPPRAVGALGKIMPMKGFYKVAGPTNMMPCRIDQLLVHEGDDLQVGEPVAIVDTDLTLPSDVAERYQQAAAKMAAYTLARSEYDRYKTLYAQDAIARERLDQAKETLDSTKSALEAARLAIKSSVSGAGRSVVRSPINGTVLAIHARNGEMIPQGEGGVVTMGYTGVMMVWAEVYETDIGRVAIGQKAIATSRALKESVTGVVEKIGLMVRPPQIFSTDPAYNTAARVVKVHIRIDNPKAVDRFSGMMVQVRIHTGQ